MPPYLCDDCKYDYGDACRRPERPNARSCPDFSPRDAVKAQYVQPQSAREFLAGIPVVTRGDHPEIRQAARQRLARGLFAAVAVLGVVGALVASLLR
ncbi:MAG: hypothetical protein AB1609_05865 [Bacillota bacterium]